MALPWKPGEYIFTHTSTDSAIITAAFEAQAEPYILRIYFGGYSKSDTGAHGGCRLLFSSSYQENEVQIDFAPVHYEGDGTYRVTGVRDKLPIRTREAYRLTAWYDVKNEHFGNAYLYTQFIAPAGPTVALPEQSRVLIKVGTDGTVRAG